MMQPVYGFCRDLDLFLENIFIGGLITVESETLLSLAELIKSAQDLNLQFAGDRLKEFKAHLEEQFHSSAISCERSLPLYFLLTEYVTTALREIELDAVEAQYGFGE